MIVLSGCFVCFPPVDIKYLPHTNSMLQSVFLKRLSRPLIAMHSNCGYYLHIGLVIFAFLQHGTAYDVPKANIKVFYPKGFEVSIPHEQGITLFAFHGKLNEEMNGLEAGTWARDIVTAKGGRWTFRDRITRLKFGDTLYYWTYVIYNSLGYREDDGAYVVKEYANATGVPNTTLDPSTSQPGSGNCKSSVTLVNGAPILCDKQIVFEENFEGTSLDTTKWTLERRNPQDPNYEFNLYLDDVDDVLKVDHGKVTIKPKATDRHFNKDSTKNPLHLGSTCTGKIDSEQCSLANNRLNVLPPLISAQFSTKGKFSFKYGLVEVKAKMPSAMWVFPQLWLEPNTPKYGDKDYRSGQMRMGQTRLDGNNMDLITGLVLNSHEPWHSFKLCVNNTSPSLSEEFQIFHLLWAPDIITFSMNNKEYCRFEISNESEAFRSVKLFEDYLPNRDFLMGGSKWAPFDQEFYLTVGYGVGGNNDFHDGVWQVEKPWHNSDPRSKQKFWNKYSNNASWLDKGEFVVNYIRIYAV